MKRLQISGKCRFQQKGKDPQGSLFLLQGCVSLRSRGFEAEEGPAGVWNSEERDLLLLSARHPPPPLRSYWKILRNTGPADPPAKNESDPYGNRKAVKMESAPPGEEGSEFLKKVPSLLKGLKGWKKKLGRRI